MSEEETHEQQEAVQGEVLEEANEEQKEQVQYTYAIAYARVSTEDKGQNPESQLVAIREWAKRKGNYVIMAEFTDKSTGKNDNRPGLDSAFGYIIRNHRQETVKFVTECLVLDLDRLSRNIDDTQLIIRDFNRESVKLIIITKESIDVTTSQGKVFTTFLASSAQDYVDNLGDKIRAGQERARREGKTIGRPLSRINKFDINLLLGYAKMGYSLRDVAKIHNCSRITITRRLKDADKLEEFKTNYNEAVGQGKKGPALVNKKYKPKKSETSGKDSD